MKHDIEEEKRLTGFKLPLNYDSQKPPASTYMCTAHADARIVNASDTHLATMIKVAMCHSNLV